MALGAECDGNSVPEVNRGARIPEPGEESLVGRADQARNAAHGAGLIEVRGVLDAGQRRSTNGSKLGRRGNRPGSHVSELRRGSGQETGRSRTPLPDSGSSEEWRRRRRKAVGAPPGPDRVGDRLAPVDPPRNGFTILGGG